MNSPSATSLTVVLNYLHTCACAMYTSFSYTDRGWSSFCLELPIVRLLFEDGIYSKKYGTCYHHDVQVVALQKSRSISVQCLLRN